MRPVLIVGALASVLLVSGCGDQRTVSGMYCSAIANATDILDDPGPSAEQFPSSRLMEVASAAEAASRADSTDLPPGPLTASEQHVARQGLSIMAGRLSRASIGASKTVRRSTLDALIRA